MTLSPTSPDFLAYLSLPAIPFLLAIEGWSGKGRAGLCARGIDAELRGGLSEMCCTIKIVATMMARPPIEKAPRRTLSCCNSPGLPRCKRACPLQYAEDPHGLGDVLDPYKGKAAKLQDVGKELGVKYVLEGSVRKAGEQLRITVQLADATTGAELWAERYDRPLRDVFALQDEIVRRIVTTLNLQLELSQRGVLVTRSTESLEAYDDLLRGAEYSLSFTKEENAKARAMFERAIELDSKYAAAYGWLGWNYFIGWIRALNPDANGLERCTYLRSLSFSVRRFPSYSFSGSSP